MPCMLCFERALVMECLRQAMQATEMHVPGGSGDPKSKSKISAD